MVDPVGDIQIPLRVYTTAVRTLQAGFRGGSTVASVAPLSSPYNRLHLASLKSHALFPPELKQNA